MRNVEYNSKEKREKIGYALLSLMQSFIKVDRKTRNYGTDVPIYFAEIHMIQSIAKHPGIHIAGLSELHEITKGSVSEIVRKLEKKGLVIKKTDPGNASRLSLTLTPKAEKADSIHTEYHAVFGKIVKEALSKANDDEVAFLLDFFEELESKVDYIEKTLTDIE